jgi:hypothetical protein
MSKAHSRNSGTTDPPIGCQIFIWALLINYVMCIVRWLITDHFSFWQGLKELIWALCPVVNFTYVWDWWFMAFGFVLGLLWTFANYIELLGK